MVNNNNKMEVVQINNNNIKKNKKRNIKRMFLNKVMDKEMGIQETKDHKQKK